MIKKFKRRYIIKEERCYLFLRNCHFLFDLLPLIQILPLDKAALAYRQLQRNLNILQYNLMVFDCHSLLEKLTISKYMNQHQIFQNIFYVLWI